jgi:5'-3' exonuclease
VTQEHQLVVTGDEAVPTQVSKGRKMPRLGLASTHEEADIIITQQAIHVSKEGPESRVCVLCDDTDVFALLLFFYSREKLQSSLTMQSPIHSRSCNGVKETVCKHCTMIPEILALHALTGCDSVAASYGIGKKTAITVVQKGYTLDQLGQLTADIANITKQATAVMAACYEINTINVRP